jgi:hypothetical protein
MDRPVLSVLTVAAAGAVSGQGLERTYASLAGQRDPHW